jgi:HPt (histidine-containing phosphotransfer) domain-containing protein
MDSYIAKPIKVDDLVETIENIRSAPRAALEERAAQPPVREPMNAALALERVGGDVGLLNEMVDLFMRELPVELTTLGEAVSSGDANAVERAAHKLKGSVANFAAGPAVEAALKLEVLGRSGSLAESASAYAELEIEINRLKSAMAGLGGGEAHP